MSRGLGLLVLAAYSFSWCFGESGKCDPTPAGGCKLKVGLVGGGAGLPVFLHNISVSFGDTRRIVAGATHAKPAKGLQHAKKAGFTGYGHWKEMLDAWRRGDQELDYVIILARTRDHYEPLKAFVEAGLPAFSEKRMGMTSAEAEEVQRIAEAKKVPVLLEHAPVGSPMLMFARELVLSGVIGEVRRVESLFNQDWAAENPGNSWLLDPKLTGPVAACANPGLDAYTMATWLCGRSVTRLSARLQSFEPRGEVDGGCTVMAEMDNGGLALITSSFVSVGFKNEQHLRIFGSQGTLEWTSISSKTLVTRFRGNVIQVHHLDANRAELPASVAAYPWDASLANLHLTMEREVRRRKGEEAPAAYPHPGALHGVQSMHFLEAVVESSKKNSAWVDVGGRRAAAGKAAPKSGWS